MVLTADNNRRRQLPRVVRATLVDADKPSIATADVPPIADGQELRRHDPDIGRPAIASNTLANPTVVTSEAHGLDTGDVVVIEGSNSTPSIDGSRVVTVVDPDTFTVAVNVTVAGTAGHFTKGTPNLRTMLKRGQASPATDV